MTGNIVRPMRLDHGSAEFADLAARYTILRGEVGSRVHGLQVGGDDRDEMGVLIEPPRYVIGVEPFEQYQVHTAGEGVRSGPDDLDLTVFSLRKWARLAGDGNPSQLLLAFIPDTAVRIETNAGRAIRDARDMFVARECAARYIGYLDEQKAHMLGQKSPRTNRPELVERYGFDTKYAGHMVRLGWQGVELLDEGTITLPMQDAQREWLVDLRNGRHTMREALDAAAESRARLMVLRELSDWPDTVDWPGIDNWLKHTYLNEWERHGLI
jgi:uncharacterized protein